MMEKFIINKVKQCLFIQAKVIRLLLSSFLFFLLNFLLKCIAQFENIAITNIEIFTEPYKPSIKNATILISHGKFKKIGLSESIKIPKEYRIINGKGKFATAGYWNSHTHFMEQKWENVKDISADSLESFLQEMFTSKGFVYVFDLAQIDFKNLNSLQGRIKNEK